MLKIPVLNEFAAENADIEPYVQMMERKDRERICHAQTRSHEGESKAHASRDDGGGRKIEDNVSLASDDTA